MSQNKYDYTWTFGSNIGSNKYINRISFTDTGITKIDSLISVFDVIGDKTFLCNRDGDPIVIFTNCSILNSHLDTIYGNYSLKINRSNYWCSDPVNYYYPFNQSMLILPDTHRKNIYPILLIDVGPISQDQDSLKSSFLWKIIFYGIEF
ncbi:MAG: hypothetical protein IPG55_10830 [Saprospiraceae bacterium]|nr:hypothetical protein [Candidatus Defluviibacterium haderslevense]